MSEYNDFPKDFVSRTIKNLENYSGNLEITNLINNCLGLIIIPKQKMDCLKMDFEFDNSRLTHGITKKNILLESNSDFSLSNTLRHIRNGLSHGRIEQKSMNKEIVGIKIHDRYSDSDSDNFIIDFTIDEFRTFAISIAKMFLRG